MFEEKPAAAQEDEARGSCRRRRERHPPDDQYLHFDGKDEQLDEDRLVTPPGSPGHVKPVGIEEAPVLTEDPVLAEPPNKANADEVPVESANVTQPSDDEDIDVGTEFLPVDCEDDMEVAAYVVLQTDGSEDTMPEQRPVEQRLIQNFRPVDRSGLFSGNQETDDEINEEDDENSSMDMDENSDVEEEYNSDDDYFTDEDDDVAPVLFDVVNNIDPANALPRYPRIVRQPGSHRPVSRPLFERYLALANLTNPQPPNPQPLNQYRQPVNPEPENAHSVVDESAFPAVIVEPVNPGDSLDIVQPRRPPVRAPIHEPVRAPVRGLARALERPPARAPERPPVRAPERPPARAPERPPVRAPERPLVRAPERPPLRAPDRPPVRAPERPPIGAPERPTVRAPERPPVRAPAPEPVRVRRTPSPILRTIMRYLRGLHHINIDDEEEEWRGWLIQPQPFTSLTHIPRHSTAPPPPTAPRPRVPTPRPYRTAPPAAVTPPRIPSRRQSREPLVIENTDLERALKPMLENIPPPSRSRRLNRERRLIIASVAEGISRRRRRTIERAGSRLDPSRMP